MSIPQDSEFSEKKRRVISVVPSTSSVGGIAKVLDYAVHAGRAGYQSYFAPLGKVSGDEGLFSKPYFVEHNSLVNIVPFDEIEPLESDILLFSLPSNHKRIIAKYCNNNISTNQLVHLVQNVRHTNIYFDNNYSFRLLTKPMTRICITQQVYDEVFPWVEDKENLHLIPHGFDFHFFDKKPMRNEAPSLVYNTFKGDFGGKIVDALKKTKHKLNVVKINSGISWDDLRAAYQGNTIFLGTPLREEGLYLPSLEAMAAGCAVVMPDAIGSRFYTVFGINCLETKYQDVDSYVEQLVDLIDNWKEQGYLLRLSAHSFAKRVGLEPEYEKFQSLLNAIS
ncbi:MAG: glycosyltransferase family 4 protein [Desulfovibrionaceae bacterium]|nr:glycosyltransferase family 4 protein [Desulfovibrionaceae bacterium]